MKTTVLILLTIFLARGCEEEKDLKSAEIEYSATTRGFFRKVTLANQTVSVQADRDGKMAPVNHKLTSAQQKVFLEAFREITLEDVPELKAPSEKRFFDGAAIAQLKIRYKGEEYVSQPFDHLNPPVEIERLVGLLAEYTIESNDD